jgi:hypothetical protein
VKNLSWVVAICILPIQVFAAEAVRTDCLAHHLNEAVSINRMRKPLYAGLTGGGSLIISNLLISTERLALAADWLNGYDRRAKSYNEVGIPILCQELVDMGTVPLFVGQTPQPWPKLQDFREVATPSLAKKLRAAMRLGDFAKVERLGLEALQTIADPAQFHCMYRHLLESLVRFAELAPRHIAAAKTKNLASPQELSALMIDEQIKAFAYAHLVDRLAAPLQAHGIPIICQDVPAIPTLSSLKF